MGEQEPEKGARVIKPTLQSFILADHVYVDALTGKKVIAGTFNQLWSSKFPTQLGQTTSVFLTLTNCSGRVEIQLRYVDLADDSVLVKSPTVCIESADRLASQEVVMEVPPLPMPHAGWYVFEAYCDGDRIGSIRMNVGKREEKPSHGTGD